MGDIVGYFGLTEPNHGSNPDGIKPHAVAAGDDYILNGAKTWIINPPVADLFAVWGKGEDEKGGGYVLEKEMVDLLAPKIQGQFSLRASIPPRE